MILHRDYNEIEKLDRVWYSSSNIVYSECKDVEGQLKTVRIVFKGGRTYVYNDVDVHDYVMFVHGGLDGSNGKAFNEFMKKYKGIRVEDTDVLKLSSELEKSLKEKKDAKKEEKA